MTPDDAADAGASESHRELGQGGRRRRRRRMDQSRPRFLLDCACAVAVRDASCGAKDRMIAASSSSLQLRRELDNWTEKDVKFD